MEQMALNHAHVYPAELLEHPTAPKHYKPRRMTVDDALEMADELGAEKVVTFPPLVTPNRHPEFNPNQWMAKAVEGRPRLIGYGTVRFFRRDLQEQVEEIHDLGLKGIKIHTSAQKLDIRSPEADIVFGAAARLGIVCDLHAGPHGYLLAHDSDPLAYDQVLNRHPELLMVIEHLGGGPFAKVMAAVIATTNVRAGYVRAWGGLTTGNLMPIRDGSDVLDIDPNDLLRALVRIGPKACIFGLDFPWHSPEEYKTAMDRLRALPLGPEYAEGLFGGNLSALLAREKTMDRGTAFNRLHEQVGSSYSEAT